MFGHGQNDSGGTRRRKWTDAQFAAAVAEVLRKLNLRPCGGNYLTFQVHAERLGLTTDHFRGQRWAKGLSTPPRRMTPLEKILVRGSTYGDTALLKHRLVREGLLAWQCSECGLTSWNGRPIPLELDHINGDRRDHRLVNLRLLCPNCHA